MDIPCVPLRTREQIANELSGGWMGQCDVCIDFFSLSCLSRLREWERWEAHVKRVHHEKRRTYAFTFTTNLGRDEIQQEMIDSCHKLYRQQTVPIEEGEAYLEYTKEGRPHIHGWYETKDGGRVFAKVFQRCWKYWKEERGKTKFAGGYHEEMKLNRYKGYSSAEGRVICLKKKGEVCIYNAPSEEHADEETRWSENDG